MPSVAHTCSGIVRHLEVSNGHLWGKPTIPYFQGTPCSLSIRDSTKPRSNTLDSATSVFLQEGLLLFPDRRKTQV